MNKAIISGRLGQDPELRYTGSGKPVATLSVATSRYVNGDQVTDWHRVTVWNKAAENAKEHLKSGDQVLVEGAIRTSKYVKDGVTHYNTAIHTNFVEYLSKAVKNRGDTPSTFPNEGDPGPEEPGIDDIPF